MSSEKNVDGFLICIKSTKFCLFLPYMVKNRLTAVKCIKLKERVLFFVKTKIKNCIFKMLKKRTYFEQ